MPSVLSKPYYEEVGWKEGGGNEGDFHIWLEDDAGRVAFDPQNFSYYQHVCDFHGLDIKKPCRHAWGNQAKWLKEKEFNSLNEADTRYIVADMFCTPQERHCRNNAIAYMVNNPEKNLKAVVGSMGWKRKNGGGVWWEFG